jgi:hypothetical protein
LPLKATIPTNSRKEDRELKNREATEIQLSAKNKSFVSERDLDLNSKFSKC